MNIRQLLLAQTSLLVAVAGIAIPVAAANAQTGAKNQNSGIEEITVTARKRGAEVAQDIPAAITALGADTLAKMGVTDFTDFAYQVPGLTFDDTGPGEKRYIIRGIQSAGQQQVAVYYDEVALPGVQSSTSDSGSQTTDLLLYDMNRIEVLRGPQGTTYGANSQTGTVRFITNKPDLEQFEASMKGDVSSTRHSGDINFGGYVMGNFPMIKDVLGLRVVAMHKEDSGYINNVRLNQKDINSVDTTALRAILRYQPTTSLTFDAMAWYQDRNLGGSPRYQPYDTFQERGNPNDIGWRDNVSPEAFFHTGVFRVGDYTKTDKPDKQQIYSLTMNWDLGQADVTATGSYYNRDFGYKFDSSWILFFLGIDPNGTIDNPSNPDPNLGRPDLFPALTDQSQSLEQTMFEARINSNWDRRWNYLVGAFWRKRKSDFQSFVPVVNSNGETFDPGVPFYDPPAVGAGIPGCQPCVFARTDNKDIKELAFFGELSYDITDQIELLAGLRWFKVDQSEVGETVFPFALFPPNPSLPKTQSASEDKLIKKFQVSYKPTDDITVYFVASQGFRLGGTNNQGVVAIPALFQSDQLWNYEIGWKTRWFDRRLTLNGSVFKLYWDNLQVSAQDPTGAFGFVTNAGAAEVTGLELELNAAPTDHWQFGFGLSWLPQKELTEDQIKTVDIGGTPVTLFAPGRKGDQIPRIPEVTLNGSVQYNYHLQPLPDWNGWLRMDWSYRSKSHTELQPFSVGNANDRPEKPYGIVNVRAGFDNDDWNAEVALFVNNITDEQGDVYVSAGNGEPTMKITNQPRTVGIEFSKKF